MPRTPPPFACKSPVAQHEPLEHNGNQLVDGSCLSCLPAMQLGISQQHPVQARWKRNRQPYRPIVGDRPKLQVWHPAPAELATGGRTMSR